MASISTTTEDGKTYWCQECFEWFYVRTPAAASSSTVLLCPRCRCDSLVEMDSHLFNPNPTPTANLIPFNTIFIPRSPPRSPLGSLTTPIPNTDADYSGTNTFQFPSGTPSAGNYLLDGPYQIQHLTNSESEGFSPAATRPIPTIIITAALLEPDPLSCAVCMDQFVTNEIANELPCKHLYHSYCILRWLTQSNTCPLCRLPLLT